MNIDSNSIIFLACCVGLWVLFAWVNGTISGWFKLQTRYPDCEEIPFKTLRFQTAAMGQIANYPSCLRFDLCPNGMRISVWRVFGLFQRPFFVPWGQINVTLRKTLLFPYHSYVQLTFGKSAVGKLNIKSSTLARIVGSGLID